jgi:Tol biopolymer transport system component
MAAPSGAAPNPAPPSFGTPVPVTIEGYRGDAMEPFVSTDGKYLFFNNRNDPGTNTDLYFARRVNDTTFAYAGALTGANSPELDAVASMDRAGHFYFVSTRSYSRTFATIYRATFANGKVSNVSIVPGVSKATPGRVNFDAAISPDGNTLYFVDARFNGANQPTSADLVIATKTATGFARVADSGRILAKVNTGDLEYGAAISSDGLTLYFTRAAAPLGSSSPAIYVATRASTGSAFGPPKQLTSLSGFVEAPALSPDGRAIYFHERVGGTFRIFRAATR